MSSNLNMFWPMLIVAVLFILLFFSPLLCFILIATLFIFVPHEYIGRFRFPLSLVAYFCTIIIFYSKDYTYANANDYLIYSQAYGILKSSSFMELFEIFPNEIGWPFVYWVLYHLGISFDGINGVSLGNTVVSLVIFIAWFEIHALKLVEPKFRCITTATTLLFMSFVSLGFLQRQALSIAILLFAISNHDNKKFFFYWILASLFHNTSFVIGLLYKILIKTRPTLRVIIFAILAFLAIRFLFLDVLNLLNKFGVLGNKANFYMRIDGFQIVSFRLAFYGLLLFVLNTLFINNVNNYMKNIILFASIFFVCFLGINLLSERVNFILIYCFGFFISLLLLPKNVKYLIIINILIMMVFVLEKTGLINSNFMFWDKYDWYGRTPFYYLEKI